MSPAPAIRIQQLVKSYGSRRVLDGFDAVVEPGRIVSLVGPSGSGKTTLLRCLNGLESIDRGTVEIAGHRLVAGLPERALDAVRADVGMVFQDFPLFPHLSLLDNVSLAPRVVRHVRTDEARERARHWLSRVGLAERSASRPSELSGGQKQRVALARALAVEVRVLLLDEPTSALDPKTRDEIRDLLSELCRTRFGDTTLTLLIVSHDIHFAETTSDEIWRLEAGRVTHVIR